MEKKNLSLMLQFQINKKLLLNLKYLLNVIGPMVHGSAVHLHN